MDKYLNTKQGSLEESVLEIWKEAANITEKKLDPVGKEDDDVDNDGDVDSSDKYLAKRRKAISKAMKKEGLEDSPNAANSQHLCAKNVVHEEWGDGECIPTMHDEPDEEGNIGWYDVMFEHGLEKGVAINELKVTHSEMHHNHKKKKNDEEVDEGIVGKALKKVGGAVARRIPGTAASKQRVIDKADKRMAQRKAKADKLKAKKDLDTKFKAAKGTLKTKKKASMFGAEYDPSVKEFYEMGTDEYRKHTQSITPGQDVTDFQNFKVESMREALAKVWGKAGDELEEYVTKEGMRRRVAEGDKRRTENKDTGKGGKTMTGKTSDVINLKPTTEEVELDEAMSKDMALKILSMAKNQDFKIASGDRAPMIYLSNDDRDELKKEFGRLGRDVPGPNKGATVMQIVNLAHSGNDRKPFDTEGGKHMISWDKGGKKIGTPKKVSDAAKLAGLKLEEVELDEVAPLIGMAAKALAKGALMGVGSKIADKAMGGKKEEKMLAADYMIKSGKSAEEVADVANVDVEEIKKVMAAYHEDDEKHYKEYLAAACSGGTGLGTTSMST